MGASQDEWKTENVEDKDYKKFLKIKKTPKKKGEYETNVEASDAPNSHEIYFSLAGVFNGGTKLVRSYGFH